jgi:hypothetical protein
MKTKRFSIEADLNDYQRYIDLKEEFDCTHIQLIKYLLSLERPRVSSGGALVAQKINQWLILGYKKEITVHALRKADYGTGKEAGLATAKKAYDLYKEEIEIHNAKFTKKD